MVSDQEAGQPVPAWANRTSIEVAYAGTGEGRGLGKPGRGKVDTVAKPRVTRASSGAPIALGVKKTAMACVRKATRGRS